MFVTDRSIILLLLSLVISAAIAGCCLCRDEMRRDPIPGNGGTGVGPLQAGAAAVDITPSAGAPLAGYGGSPRREFNFITTPLNLLALGGTCVDPNPADVATFFEPSTGKRDPIMARALVLSNGIRKIALVKLDTVGMTRRLRDDLADAAAPLGIAAQDLVAVATHTHSGPGALSDQSLWQVAGADCFNGSLYRDVLDGATQALQAANAALQPALLGIGTTTVQNASKNRRGRPSIVDRELGVVKITTTASAPLAVMFNFAVHGTSFGASNMQFSADCMGAMESFVEAGLPGAVAIFTNGAEGDVAPEHNGAAGVQMEGSIVGNAVLAQWAAIPTKGSIELRTAFEDVVMPAPSFNAAAGCLPLFGSSTTLCSALGLSPTLPLPSTWLSTTLPFQALRIDDTVFVAVPGEPITEIGWEIKQRAINKGFARGFVLGLANDHGGYFTTLAEYNRGEYEGQATLYGPTTGDVVVQSADDVMTQVQ